MLKNYLKIALRTLRRQPVYAAVNVAGLAVGLACCLLIGLYVQHEWRYDRFHERAERIHRLYFERQLDTVQRLALTNGQAGPALARSRPEVETAVRMARRSADVRVAGGAPEAAGLEGATTLIADAAFFDVFSFPVLQGRAGAALDAPHTAVLTRSAAARLFGAESPVGRAVLIGDEATPYTIVGVAEDPPATSHLQFDLVASFATIEATSPEALRRSQFWTYLLLDAPRPPPSLQPILDDYLTDQFGQEALAQVRYRTQPLTDVHLRSDLMFDLHAGGSAEVVLVLALVALLVLALATINFVNLATARASRRAREVGVRKALGAPRRSLAAQFLVESCLMAAFGMGGALGLVQLGLPAFEAFTGRTLVAGWLFGPEGLGALAVGTALLGALAGLYPAAVLSGFRAARVLRGALPDGRQATRFRQGLVVVQFVATIGLLAATFIAFEQLDYVRSKDLGFDEARLVSVDVPGGAPVAERLRTAFAHLAGVEAVTADSGPSPTSMPRRILHREGADSAVVHVNFFYADADFADVMEIEVKHGRAFDPDRATDSTHAALLNRAAVAALGWSDPAEAVGERLRFGPNAWTVVGVTGDYHFASLHEAVEPLLIEWRPEALRRLLVRLGPGPLDAHLAALGARWDEVVPEHPFAYRFLDDTLAGLYEADRQFGRIFALFAGLALAIAGLGAFGLATLATEQRTKEIGIRKVLGATVAGLVGRFAGEFAALVGLAFVVAAPLAYLGMARWLETFAYRTEVGPGVFLAALAVALAVALVTVGLQALRAALADPVDALRYE